MNRKLLSILLDVFARIATCIFIFSSIYITIFWGPHTDIGISYVWGVLFIALVCTLARIPLLFTDTFSKTKIIVSNIVYFVFVNVLVIAVGYYLQWFDPSQRKMIVGIEITIFVVYLMVMVVSYLLDLQTANKMNKKLQNRKEE
jgi:hypothetical protein